MIEVAIIDSGLTPDHPHLSGLVHRGFALIGAAPPLRRDPDYRDVTGHGTAVAAALHRLVSDVRVLAIRLLDAELRTSTAALCAAIEAAADEGVSLINLSLGSGSPDSEQPLRAAVAYAEERGAVCIAAAHPRGRPLWPADLPTVVSATTHRSCPLADLFTVPGPLPRFVAHGLPRAIEGRPPSDNFYGPSFAAVHVTARAAALIMAGVRGREALVLALTTEARGPLGDAA